MFRVINIAITAIFLTSPFVLGQKSIFDEEKAILDQILAENRYDPRIRAYHKLNGSISEEPSVVTTNIYFRSIEYVCAKKMEWKVQLTFRQQWNDARLEFNDLKGKVKYLQLNDINQIWRPDVFFSNSRSSLSHAELSPNNLVRIYPNGNVLFSTRVTLTLSCSMDVKHFPFDDQTCSVQLASYGYTTDNIIFLWKDSDPIQVTRYLNIPGMTLIKYTTDYCTSRTNTGEYSCMKANFQFRRTLSSYMKNWFIPTIFITFASFVSFWLRRDQSSRMLTLVVTLLALYFTIVLINYQLPPVSYTTAIDCWTGTCLIFVVSALLEYGIVKFVDGCNKCNNKKTDSNNGCKMSNNCEEGDAVAMKPLVDENHADGGGKEYTVNDLSNRRNYVQKWRDAPLACRIDFISGIAFPLLFLVYIIIFFSYHAIRRSVQF